MLNQKCVYNAEDDNRRQSAQITSDRKIADGMQNVSEESIKCAQEPSGAIGGSSNC
jgi:hypothetical protein